MNEVFFSRYFYFISFHIIIQYNGLSISFHPTPDNTYPPGKQSTRVPCDALAVPKTGGMRVFHVGQ